MEQGGIATIGMTIVAAAFVILTFFSYNFTYLPFGATIYMLAVWATFLTVATIPDEIPLFSAETEFIMAAVLGAAGMDNRSHRFHGEA